MKRKSNPLRRSQRLGNGIARRSGGLFLLAVSLVVISAASAPFVHAQSTGITGQVNTESTLAAVSQKRFEMSLCLFQKVQEDAHDSFPIAAIEDFRQLSQDSRCSPGLYVVGSFDEAQPSVIFIPGANSPPNTFNHYMQRYQERYNMFIFYYNYLDHLDETAGFLNRELLRVARFTGTADFVLIAHSFGNNVLMNAVLNSDESALFKRCHVIRLTPTVAGSRKACNASRKFRQFFMGLASFLPKVNDFRNIAAAQDPLGATIQSLVLGFEQFKEKVKAVHTFAVLGDSHAPSENSPGLFQENYRNCILSEASILEPITSRPHVEVLHRKDIINGVDIIVSETSRSFEKASILSNIF